MAETLKTNNSQFPDMYNANGPMQASSSRATFPISSYTWSLKYDQRMMPTEQNTPVLKLKAFKPLRKFYPLLQLQMGAANAFVSALTPDSTAKGFVAKASSLGIDYAITTGTQALYNSLIQSLTSKNDTDLNNGYSMVVDMFRDSPETGDIYELPFLSEEFLNAKGSVGWDTRGLGEAAGEGDRVTKYLIDKFGINIPLQPTWSASTTKANDNIDYTFYLINDSADHFASNISFLISLVKNCYWSQLSELQQPPNIFEAVVPGRFRWKWAALSTRVDYMGRVRVFGEVLVPDVYKVSVSLANLCPDNLNTFLAYFGNVSDNGYNSDNMAAKLVVSFSGHIKDAAVNVMKDAGSDITEAYENAKTFIGF